MTEKKIRKNIYEETKSIFSLLNKKSLLPAFFCLSILLPAQKTLDKIAAVVGDEIITSAEVDNQLLMAQAQGQDVPDKCAFMENALLQMLLVSEAKQDTLITISQEEVKSKVDYQIEEYRKKVPEQTLLSIFGVNSMYDLRKEMEVQLTDQMYAQRKQYSVTQSIDATPQEVLKFYEQNKSYLPHVPEQIELSHIVLKPVITKENKQKIIDKLNTIKEDIKGGSQFSTKALIYSEDPGSSNNGGLYEKVKRGKFVKEFEEVAFTLEEGEISEPFETEYGFHIVMLEKRRGEEIDVRHILIKPVPTEQELYETRLLADSLKVKIDAGKLTFENAVLEYSSDKFTKYNGGVLNNPKTNNTKFNRQDLPVKVEIALAGLNQGALSDPIEEEQQEGKVIRLVKLNRVIPEHDMNYNIDFEQLKEFTTNQNQQAYLLSWASEKIPYTFIKLDKVYNSCNFSFKWNN